MRHLRYMRNPSVIEAGGNSQPKSPSLPRKMISSSMWSFEVCQNHTGEYEYNGVTTLQLDDDLVLHIHYSGVTRRRNGCSCRAMRCKSDMHSTPAMPRNGSDCSTLHAAIDPAISGTRVPTCWHGQRIICWLPGRPRCVRGG